ncbi:hypothetical protein QZH41_000737 [Actinostola sp. cb2023]|nr:hypothetical protein QZH41_000737 [Actinostola sp. cb2023]
MNMSEAKTGFLWLSKELSCGTTKQKLRVVAYMGVSDPFVVFYNEETSVWRKPCAVLRLSNEFRVQINTDLSFEVTPLGERIGNGPTSLTFTAENQDDKEEWIRIFQNSLKETEAKKTRKERRKSSWCIPKLAAIEETDEGWEQKKRMRDLLSFC